MLFQGKQTSEKTDLTNVGNIRLIFERKNTRCFYSANFFGNCVFLFFTLSFGCFPLKSLRRLGNTEHGNPWPFSWKNFGPKVCKCAPSVQIQRASRKNKFLLHQQHEKEATSSKPKSNAPKHKKCCFGPVSSSATIFCEYFMRHCKLAEISIFQIHIWWTHS